MKYIFGDPLFANPEEGDFSFRPGSPALALGIEPLNVSKMGRLDDRSLRISDGSRFVPKDFFILSLAGRPRRAISCLETRTVCCVRSKFVSLPSKRVFSVLKSHMAWENSGEVDIGRLAFVSCAYERKSGSWRYRTDKILCYAREGGHPRMEETFGFLPVQE